MSQSHDRAAFEAAHLAELIQRMERAREASQAQLMALHARLEAMPAPSNGFSKIVVGSAVGLACTLLVSVVLGLFSMSQKVSLNDERHTQMAQVDQEQSRLIQTCLQSQQEMMRQIDLIRERQGLNTRAVESHSGIIGGIVTLNSEQQYQLGLLQERLRLLERARAAERVDQP